MLADAFILASQIVPQKKEDLMMASHTINKGLSKIVLVFLFHCTVYSQCQAKSLVQLIPHTGPACASVVFQTFIAQSSAQEVSPEMHNEAARIVAIVIHWVVVPLILIIIFLYALFLPYIGGIDSTKKSGVSKDSIRKAGTAGIFAGLIIFLIFIVTQPGEVYQFSSDIPAYSFSFYSFLTAIVGFILGFGLLVIISEFRNTSKLAFLIMILVASTTITLYCYFLFVLFRSTVVYISLGGMLGGLVKIMVDPD